MSSLQEVYAELALLRRDIEALKKRNSELEKTKKSLTEATEFLAYALRRHKKHAEEIRNDWNEAVRLVLDVSTVMARLELALENKEKEIERLKDGRI